SSSAGPARTRSSWRSAPPSIEGRQRVPRCRQTGGAMVLVRRSLLLLAVLFVASGAQAAKWPLRPPATPAALRPFLLSPGVATRPWSTPFGLNMRWSAVPTKLPGKEYPGLVQWTPVDSASAYDVWFDEPNKIVRTKTNAADEREYYTFHQLSPWPDVVHWRVRA